MKYIVDVHGMFVSQVEVEVDAADVYDDMEDTVYDLAEKQLHEMFAKGDYSLVDDIQLECVDYNEA
jgi:hypothetical protein